MSIPSEFISPADLATAGLMDGTKWNAFRNWLKRINAAQAHAYIVKEGSTYIANKSDGTIVSGSDAYTVVNTALTDVYTANSMATILLGPFSFDFANQSLNLLAKSNVAIVGAGMDLTTILNGAITNTGGVTTNNIALKDLTINANSNRGNCVNLQKVTDMRLTSVKLMNSSSSFVFNWSSADRLIADKCIFIDGGLTVSADNCAGGQILTTENESIFRNCHFQKTSSLGGGQLTTGGTGKLLVDGCTFVDASTNSYAAVSIENTLGTVKEVRIVDCRSFGQSQGFQIGNGTTNPIDRGMIRGCISVGPQGIMGAKQAIIADGMSYNSRGAGFQMSNNTVAKLANCIALDTNATDAASDFDKGGFYGTQNTRLEISGLDVYDTTGFTPHGIRASSTALDTKKIYIANCNLVGPFSAAPLQLTNFLYAQVRGGSLVGTPTFTTNTTLRINNVEGYVTEAQGTSTITSGNTSVAVTHGLSYTPTAAEIGITFTENPTVTPGMWWPSSIGATTFTVNVENNPSTSNLDFSWSVRRI